MKTQFQEARLDEQFVIARLQDRVHALEETREMRAGDLAAITQAAAWLESMYLDATCSLKSVWIEPLINFSSDGEVLFEWWKGNRKVTVYITAETIEAKKTDLDLPIGSRTYAPAENSTQRIELWSWLVSDGIA